MLDRYRLSTMAQDPVKHAKQLAENKLSQRIELIKQLSAALQWERDIRELRSRAKSISAEAPDSALEPAQAVQDNIDKLLQTATEHTKASRSSARSEWTQEELKELGLVSTRQRRKAGQSDESDSAESDQSEGGPTEPATTTSGDSTQTGEL